MSHFSRPFQSPAPRRLVPLSQPSLERTATMVIPPGPLDDDFVPLKRENTMFVGNMISDVSDIDADFLSDDDVQLIDHHSIVGAKRPTVTEELYGDLFDDDGVEAVIIPQGKKNKVRARQVVADDDVPLSNPAPKGQGRLVTRYCFTYNNPTVTGEEFDAFLKSKEDIKGFVFQQERGTGGDQYQGTVHYQGYMELGKRMYTSGAHAMLAPHRMSLLHATSSKAANKKYCTKEDTREAGPWLYGTLLNAKSGSQGKRTDIDQFADLVIEHGGVNSDVEEAMPGHAVRFGKLAEQFIARKTRREAEQAEQAYWVAQYEASLRGETATGQQQRHLELFFGPTAVGKTTQVKREVIGKLRERLYSKNCANKWWCGYNNEKHVLMDEFKGDKFGNVEEFNALSNVGCTQVETKGGQTVLLADNMYFTTNRHPSQWWKKDDGHLSWSDATYRAVARRFAKVHWWNDANELLTLLNPGQEPDSDSMEHSSWLETSAKWRHFWEWKDRPSRAGDSFIPSDNNYFSWPF